jgi:hypothetical protein
MTLDGAAAGKRTVARKSAEMPDAHGAFGLQMPRASSTIPTPAITISEAAPAPAQKPAAQSSVWCSISGQLIIAGSMITES